MKIEPNTTDDRNWQAVADRRRDADGRFVYAVATTGIYCRPSCASRRPLRRNVKFFAAPDAAERAGYRPCLRCKPRDDHPDDAAAARLSEVRAAIDRALEEGDAVPSLRALGEAVGLSPFHLQRSFKRRFGMSPREYGAAKKLGRVKSELATGSDVTGALYAAGYGAPSRLYERAKTQLGMTPATYKNGGAGAAIGFATAKTQLGTLLIAATDKGVCAVSLGPDAASLEAALKREYPAATIAPDRKRLESWLKALLRHIDGKEPGLDLPLDLVATAFQWRVWRALRAIPYGTTTSYAAIARAIGAPAAVRAVASACANNQAALVIPCHRVVRGDGQLAGYRWGIERKAKLLAREKKFG
jgi:AraC family transcriptional regulator of adaptative response/methylated-DNA-[protein]-cysteine methyltransferase